MERRDEPEHRHPWRRVAHPVRFGHLEGGRLGAWDPETGTIWIAHGLTQAERRSTLAHEQIHAERADEACASPWHEAKVERLVEREAARRLISLDALVLEMLWTQNLHDLAEALWVDETTLQARLDGLTTQEHGELERRLFDAERWIA